MDTNQNTGKLNGSGNWLRKSWRNGITFLFAAPDSVAEVGERRQAELLARLTFFFALLNTIGLLFVLRSQNAVGILVILILSIVLWVAYGLSRTRYYSAGGILAVIVWVVITFAYALSGSTTNGSLFVLVTFLPLVFSFGTALLQYRQQIFLVGISLVFCFLMPVFEPGISSNRSFRSSLGVLVCLGGMTLLNQNYRDRIERERLAELKTKNESIRFQAELLDRVGQAVIASRLDNTTLYWNHAAEKMYGWKAEEALGKNVFEITPIETTPKILEEIDTALHAGNDWHGESAIRHRDGHLIPILYTIAPLKGLSGKTTGWVSVAADITERKKAEKAREHSEEMYRRAIITAGAVPYYLDQRTRTYTFMGEGILQMTGYSAAEMHPDLWETLEQEGFPRGNLAHLTYAEADELTENDGSIIWECDYRILTRDGQTRWVADTSVKGLNEFGERVGVIGILQDITDRKLAEIEREKLIEDLERQNGELERFTYTVSHDLKSPLVTIKGYLGYIEQDIDEGNIDRVKKDLQRISDATTRMQSLLNDLLELSRIGRVINQLMDVPFEEIVQEAVNNVTGQIQAKNVKVNISPNLPIVHVDKTRLVEVLQNLLDNACKYMGDQPEPRIEIGYVIKNGKSIFHVRDNGMGIEKEFYENIFGLFNKLNSSSEGTGIGLALIKRIIELHNGRIWVESKGLGKGSTFYFILPIKE